MSLPINYFRSFDGQEIAYRETGEGRPVVLIHGFFSNATINWITYGHAARIAEAGFRVIMPDLRGHGDSAKPHDLQAYPRDALTDDGFALIEHLQLTDYDLGGYSLGARTTARMLARGATPARVIFSGMGLSGLEHTDRRAGHFRTVLREFGTAERGSEQWKAESFLRKLEGDPQAMLGVIETFTDTPAASIAAITQPTLVLNGAADDDNGSAQELAQLLPDAELVEIAGDHMSAVANPELGSAIANFLTSKSVQTGQ